MFDTYLYFKFYLKGVSEHSDNSRLNKEQRETNRFIRVHFDFGKDNYNRYIYRNMSYL